MAAHPLQHLSFFFCREPFSPDLGRYHSVEAGCGRHLFASQLARGKRVRWLCWWWLRLGKVCSKTSCRQGIHFLGFQEAGFLFTWSTFSPTLCFVEGMNVLCRGCLVSCSLYLVFLKDKVSPGLTEPTRLVLCSFWFSRGSVVVMCIGNSGMELGFFSNVKRGGSELILNNGRKKFWGKCIRFNHQIMIREWNILPCFNIQWFSVFGDIKMGKLFEWNVCDCCVSEVSLF